MFIFKRSNLPYYLIIKIALLAISVLLYISPLSSSPAYAADCTKGDSNKRYRCNFTKGKWWKGVRAPSKSGQRLVHDDGEVWFNQLLNTVTNNSEIVVNSQRRTSFLDRAATDRRIRVKDNTRGSAVLAGQFILGLSIPVSVIWSNTNQIKTLSAIASVGANTLYNIVATHWRWAANDGNRFNFNKGLCYYSVSTGTRTFRKKFSITNNPPRLIYSPRHVTYGWYSNEFTPVCK